MSRSTMTGASQNVGNQLGDRSSTRVRMPPGGGSSISFAWSEPEAPVASGRRAAPAPEPAGSMYTTTASGIGTGGYTAAASYAPARTTAAPFGTDYGVPAPMIAPSPYRGGAPGVSGAPGGAIGGPADNPYMTSAAAYGGGSSYGSAAAPSPYSARSGGSYHSAPGSGVNDILTGGGPGLSSNAFASGANQNAGNVLTDRRTTRVLSAPGGKSSITFG